MAKKTISKRKVLSLNSKTDSAEIRIKTAKPRGRPFQKGVSGNPGGRPKEDVHVRVLARERTEEAISTLVEVMRNGKLPAAARVAASCALLDRGFGKPGQAVELTGKDGNPIQAERITSTLDPKEAASLYKEYMNES